MKSVVICSSRRFKKEVLEWAEELKKSNINVYIPFYNVNNNIMKIDEDLKDYSFHGLVRHHMDFVRKAEVIFVYNKDGYVGNSTIAEIGAAHVLNKPVFALTKEVEDNSIKVLIDEEVKTAKDLIKKLL